ncbi:MAG TPA: MoaD/ThiS family protein, partial [Pyrinomonadaceae bacterium]|nr:MoaD/ThiS family protein [Pyrinomonadaceae bacterium]
MTLAENSNNEITVTVLFFGAARDAVGQGEVNYILNGRPTAATALAELLEEFPGLKRFGRSLLFAVNQEYAATDREVRDGDEL